MSQSRIGNTETQRAQSIIGIKFLTWNSKRDANMGCIRIAARLKGITLWFWYLC